MNIYGLLIFTGVIFLLLLVIVWQYFAYRSAIKAKDYGIVVRIQEQSRLARELEHAQIEKQTHVYCAQRKHNGESVKLKRNRLKTWPSSI